MKKHLFLTLLSAVMLFMSQQLHAQLQPASRGLNYWYTASVVNLDGSDHVTGMPNQVYPSVNAEKATYNPQNSESFATVNASGFAGKPSVSFTGNDGFLVHYIDPESSTTVPYTSGTYVLGIKTPASFTEDYMPLYKFANDNEGALLYIQDDDLVFACYGQVSSVVDYHTITYPLTTEEEYIITAQFDADARFMELFINGVSVGRTAFLFDDIDISEDYHGRIGGLWASNLRVSSSVLESSPLKFSGEVAYVLIYNNTVLSTEERYQTEDYIRESTGISTPPSLNGWFSCLGGDVFKPLVRYETGASASDFLIDHSGYGWDASVLNLPTLSSNVINGHPAMLFASGVEMQIPSTMMLDKGNSNAERTYAMVIKPTDISTRQFIYKQGDTERGVNVFIEDEALHFTFYYYDNGSSSWQSSVFSYPLSNTDPLSITIADKAGAPYVAVNGNLVSGLPSSLTVRPVQGWSKGPAFIGSNSGGTYDGTSTYTSGAPFTGYIAEFGIFSKAFTAEELAILHNYQSTQYGIFINQNQDYYRWQEFYPNYLGGLNQEILSSCSEELRFETDAVSSGKFLHIGHNNETATDLLVGDHTYYNPSYTVPANVTRSKRAWRVDIANAGTPYPSFGSSQTVDFTLPVADFPVSTVLSHQKEVMIVDADGDFSSNARIYVLTKDVSETYYQAAGITVSAGDHISFGVLNLYEYSGDYPYETQFIYTTNSGVSNNLIDINGVQITALNGTSLYNYLGVAVNNTTSLEFNPMAVIPAISCKWKVTHYGNVGPLKFTWTPEDAGITDPLDPGEEYVLAYESYLSYGYSTNYIHFSLVDGKYEVPILDLPGDTYEFTILKRSVATPLHEKTTFAVLKEVDEEISDQVTKGVIKLYGKDAYSPAYTGSTKYDDLASQCPQSVYKASLYMTFNTGDDYRFGTNAFTTSVTFSVWGKTNDYGGIVNFGSFTLGLDEENPEQLQVVDLTDYINGYPYQELTVTVTDFTSTGNTSFDDALELRAELVNDKRVLVRQDVGQIIESQTAVLSSGNKTCTFSWTSSLCDAYTYQFQLLRLFNGPVETAPDDEQDLVNADIDWNQALTLETKNTTLTLTLAEGTGYYAWRVRPVGNYYEGDVANNHNWGPWSSEGIEALTAPLTLSASTDLNTFEGAVLYYTQFDEDKNFIYNRAFTEDAKIHEGISFANGLQQLNQTQAKINSNGENGQVLISESVYDFSGRASLQSMAAPDESDNDLGYRSSALAYDDKKYNAFNFDADAKLNAPDPMEDGLINLYYSDLNTDPQIPDAEGYPYTRELYDNDGINRAIEQGGVGKVHSIGNKTVKIEYSTATDLELLMVFGDEAPKGNTVLKTKTTDQNNVSSITYTDLSGKVIATSLVKNEESSNLEDLDPSTYQTKHISDKLNNNVPIGEVGVTATKKYTFSETTDVEVHMEVTPYLVFSDCQTFCQTCSYIVEVKVINDRTNEVISQQSTSFGGDFSGACPDPEAQPEFEPVDVDITIADVPPGTYTITKKIMFDESKAAEYAEALRNQIDDDLQDVLDLHVMSYVDAQDFQGLADHLEALYQTPHGPGALPDNYDIIITSSDPYVAGTPLVTGDQVTIGPSCCAVTFTIEIPELDPCEQYDYDVTYGGMSDADARLVFGGTLADKYGAAFTTTPYPISTTEFGAFTRDNLRDLFSNMLAESYYTCPQIWNAWQAQIVLASVDFDGTDNSNGFDDFKSDAGDRLPGNFSSVDASDADEESRNPVLVFLKEMQRQEHINGYLKDQSDDLRTHAYKVFYYDRPSGGPSNGTVDKYCEHRYCIDQRSVTLEDICDDPTCVPDEVSSEDYGYTLEYDYGGGNTMVLNQDVNQYIVQFYYCINNTISTPITDENEIEEFYLDLLAQKTQLESDCKDRCEQKRGEFLASLNEMYDPDGNGTLFNSESEEVEPEDLCCTADQMVDACKNECYLSVVRDRCDGESYGSQPVIMLSLGTQEERDHVSAIMGGDYEIQDGAGGSCGTGFEAVDNCHELVGLYHLNGNLDQTDYAHETDTDFELTIVNNAFDDGRTGENAQAMHTPNSYAYTSESDTRGITDEVTVAAWVKMTDITGSGNKTIVRKMDSNNGFHLYTKNGYAYFDVKDNGTTYSSGVSIYGLQFNSTENKTTDPFIEDTRWHMVTGVCRDGNTVEIWIDGQLQKSTSFTAGSITDISTTDPLTIAGFAGDEKFEGYIDEVYLYSCALGKGAIYDLYEETINFDLDGNGIQENSNNCSEGNPEWNSNWNIASGFRSKIYGTQKVSDIVWSYGFTWDITSYSRRLAHIVYVNKKGNKKIITKSVGSSDDCRYIDMVTLVNGQVSLLMVSDNSLYIHNYSKDGVFLSQVFVSDSVSYVDKSKLVVQNNVVIPLFRSSAHSNTLIVGQYLNDDLDSYLATYTYTTDNDIFSSYIDFDSEFIYVVAYGGGKYILKIDPLARTVQPILLPTSDGVITNILLANDSRNLYLIRSLFVTITGNTENIVDLVDLSTGSQVWSRGLDDFYFFTTHTPSVNWVMLNNAFVGTDRTLFLSGSYQTASGTNGFFLSLNVLGNEKIYSFESGNFTSEFQRLDSDCINSGDNNDLNSIYNAIEDSNGGGYFLIGCSTINFDKFFVLHLDNSFQTQWIKPFKSLTTLGGVASMKVAFSTYNLFYSLNQFSNESILLSASVEDYNYYYGNCDRIERTAPPEYLPAPGTGPTLLTDNWYICMDFSTTCTAQPVCLKWVPPIVEVEPVDPVDPTVETKKDIIKRNTVNAINMQLGQCYSSNLEAIYNEYTSQCRGNIAESCTVEYDMTMGHFTLYYYDRAGNLVTTVPPAGVNFLDVDPDDVEASRADHPEHHLKTTYKYNSLGQLVEQVTPDGGLSIFRYNRLGMLRFSKNAQQKEDSTFSYTKYDKLGRTLEVGQGDMEADGLTFLTLPVEAEGSYTDFELTAYPTAHTAQETFTVYNDAATHVNYLGVGQQYLRNRVSYSFTKGMDGNKSVSYFSYDPHGNVKWIVQELPGIGKSTVGYEYDLISNKVTKVKMNENRPDQFFHRYFYDADNRITLVETSPNGYLWDRDAAYHYYKHGPLRRTELGEDHVQGLDYTYTIQGWLKAMNAPSLDASYDPGLDGTSSSTFQKDEYGFVLGYYGAETGFNGDFNRTGSIFNAPASGTATATGLTNSRPLYNGNISSWITRIDAEESGYKVTGNTYGYDFLNRLLGSSFHTQSGTSNFASAGTDYYTGYAYDANGNIEKLVRHQKTTTGNDMDSLVYNYNTFVDGGTVFKNNNRLRSVNDPVSAGASGVDIDDQSEADNYLYDEIGNLTEDKADNKLITWNVYGKVDQVKRRDPSLDEAKELRFVYDAMGNRIEKEVNEEPYDGSLQPQRLIDKLVTTYYVRDASGNVMAIYERHNTPVDGQPDYYEARYTLKEIPLYGSSRVGMHDAADEEVVVATKIFHKDDYFNVNFDFKQVDLKTEYNNWMTSALTTDDLAGSLLPSMSLHKVDFNSTTPNPAALSAIERFTGVNGKDVSIAEDDYGQVVFYTVTMAKYMGKTDVLLLFDGNGRLMPNSGAIKADANARTVIVKSPAGDKQYVLVTRSADDHKLYAHVIDMNLRGNGTSPYDKQGDVSVKNTPMDAANTYGTHLLGIEDRSIGKAFIYASHYKAPADPNTAIGTTELTLFEVSNSGTSLVKAPSKLCTEISSWEDLAQSQLQVSPDGKKLVMINHQENLGWFGAQKSQAIVFDMGSNYRLASNLIVDATVLGTGISMPHQAAEFSADSRFLYYSQQRLTEKPAFNSMGRVDLRSNTLHEALFEDRLAQLQRSKYGLVYAYSDPNSWKAYDEDEEGQSETSSSDDFAFSYLDGGVLLNRYVSSQNRIVYRLSGQEPLLFSRRVGKKNYELSDHLGNVTVVVTDRVEPGTDTEGANLVPNGDMAEVSSPGSGMADNWVWQSSISGDPSVVTGPGFTGNAQRIEISAGKTRAIIKNVFSGIVSGKTYKVSFKYRSNIAFKANGNTALGNGLIENVPANNTVLPVSYSYTGTANGNEVGIFFDLNTASPGDWLEVDDVRVTVQEADGLADAYSAEVLSYTNYYAFGMAMPGRNMSSELYRYGFNGQEKVEEIAPGHTTAMYWEYDARLGRRWNLDPKGNPSISYYSCFSNNPVFYNDPYGDTTRYTIQKGDNLTKIAKQKNTTVELLQRYNPSITNINEIKAGETLNIPGAQNPELIDGDFVAVINAPEGAGGYGHNALMIGNDKTGWSFISKEGRLEDESSNLGNNPVTGGRALPAREAKFGTIQDLFESKYFKEYKKGAVFSLGNGTASPLVQKMRKEAVSKYILLAQNCSHACGSAMASVGLDPGYMKVAQKDRWGQKYESWILSPIPNIQYKHMIQNNKTRFVTTIGQ